MIISSGCITKPRAGDIVLNAEGLEVGRATKVKADNLLWRTFGTNRPVQTKCDWETAINDRGYRFRREGS